MTKFFIVPFADSGDKIAVPDDAQPSGAVSYTAGFTIDYAEDPATNPAGKDVPREQVNQLYYDVTSAIRAYQTFGTPDFITSLMNGGSPFSYSKYARVLYSGNIYQSRVNSNTALPTDVTKWRLIDGESGSTLIYETTNFDVSVSTGQAVFWDTISSKFKPALAANTAQQYVVGVADVTNGKILISGLYITTGLTAGAIYYLSSVTPGLISATAPTSGPIVQVGIALSTTTLNTNIQHISKMHVSKFTISGSFVVPLGITKIWLSGVASGAGGGGSAGSVANTPQASGGAGGGGGGESFIKYEVSVTPGETLTISIGLPGNGGALGASGVDGSDGAPGGDLTISGSFGTLTLAGGLGGAGSIVGGAGVLAHPGLGGAPGGSTGQTAIYISADIAPGAGGNGAPSPYGIGGSGYNRTGTGVGVAGEDAIGYGSGGGGAGGSGSYTGFPAVAGANGGNGAPGLLIIEY